VVSDLSKEKSSSKNNHLFFMWSDLDFVPLPVWQAISMSTLWRGHFHEKYGLHSTVWGKYATGPCYNSDIITFYACEQNDLPEYFMQHVWDFAKQHRDKKVLLIGLWRQLR